MEAFDRVVPVLACRRSGAYRVGSGGFDQGGVSLALRVVVGRRYDFGGWVLGVSLNKRHKSPIEFFYATDRCRDVFGYF